MKIKLYFEKENLIRLAVAVVFAAVLFAVIRFRLGYCLDLEYFILELKV